MAPAGLKLRELHSGRAAAQPGHRHAHVAVDERRDSREIALDGTTAVVEDAAGHPDGRERLRAGVKRAGPRGTPQVPEGGARKYIELSHSTATRLMPLSFPLVNLPHA